MSDRAKPWLDRFWSRVEKTDGCWLWRGRIGAGGYGDFDLTTEGRNRTWRAHRVSFLLANGYEPQAPLEVCHTCDVRRCVNPRHLYAGTRSQNMRDCVARGRHARHWSKKTQCPHGHSLSNALVDKRGWRRCRECHRTKMIRDNAARRQTTEADR